jgi:hypothetical protein
MVFQARGNVDKALITLMQALILAEPGGFIRIFVDEGRWAVCFMKLILAG